MAWARKSSDADGKARQREPSTRSQPHLADDKAPATPSPALGLQRKLDAAYSGETRKWSARRTLLFIVGTCGGFWAAVFAVLFLRR